MDLEYSVCIIISHSKMQLDLKLNKKLALLKDK
jgi:hypothetical protein